MKKAIALVAALTMAASMTACGSKAEEAPAAEAASSAAASSAAEEATEEAEAPAESGDSYVVGICQFVQHPALDAATKGFKDALTEELGDAVTFDEQNAAGESPACSTIINQFVSSKVDLIMANATPPLQAAAAATDSIPILGTSVTDYATALEIDDWSGATGRNISGTSDLAPLADQAKMLNELFPEAKTVGVLYCSAEANSKYQCDVITEELTGMGYEVKAYPFADSNDIASVTTSATNEVEVIYVPTDNAAASNTEIVNNICEPAG
ncbi:MAG: ABC transporter substrate-binding protein, partial [Lachnospiraceae bacterium]|nr:ABC transporter substrate-binding protein [Lachnospiraceae bacterium]